MSQKTQIKQGSILGAALTKYFITDDIPEGIESCCYIFADDFKMYSDTSAGD